MVRLKLLSDVLERKEFVLSMIEYLREDLHAFFDDKTYHRGIMYYAQGRVKNVTMEGPSIIAQIKGSRLFCAKGGYGI